MPVIRYYASKHLRSLVNEYIAEMKDWGNDFAYQLEIIIKDVIAQTFRFATTFGSTGASNLADPSGLYDATVETKSKVWSDRRGLLIEIKTTVVDPSGKVHLEWHILSQGRKAYIFPEGKRSPMIRKRKGHRTQRGNLKVKPFPGFVGDETFVIVGGTLVAGIKARDWYKAADKEFRQRVKKLPNVEDMRFRRSTIKKLRA